MICPPTHKSNLFPNILLPRKQSQIYKLTTKNPNVWLPFKYVRLMLFDWVEYNVIEMDVKGLQVKQTQISENNERSTPLSTMDNFTKFIQYSILFWAGFKKKGILTKMFVSRYKYSSCEISMTILHFQFPNIPNLFICTVARPNTDNTFQIYQLYKYIPTGIIFIFYEQKVLFMGCPVIFNTILRLFVWNSILLGNKVVYLKCDKSKSYCVS